MTLELDMGDWVYLLRDLLAEEQVRLPVPACRNMVRISVVAFFQQHSAYNNRLQDETGLEWCVHRFYNEGFVNRPSRSGRRSTYNTIDQTTMEDIVEKLMDRIYGDVTLAIPRCLPYDGIIKPRFTAREWVKLTFLSADLLNELKVDLGVDSARGGLNHSPKDDTFEVAYRSVDTLYRFKDWLDAIDQERLRPISQETHDLVDQFIDHTGWV